jgi:hypothetical protein
VLLKGEVLPRIDDRQREAAFTPLIQQFATYYLPVQDVRDVALFHCAMTAVAEK